jgi:hypothetical protein
MGELHRQSEAACLFHIQPSPTTIPPLSLRRASESHPWGLGNRANQVGFLLVGLWEHTSSCAKASTVYLSLSSVALTAF